MAKNTTLGRIWNRLDRTVRNTMNLDKWPGVRPWNKIPTDISTSQDFDMVDLEPREYYVGQLYGAIRTRANRIAELAKEHTKTRTFGEEETEETHPYLTLINESPQFANTYFWKALSTFLDLPGGTAYIFALRNYNSNVVGETKEFQIINPYRLTKVVNGSNPDEYTYIEHRGNQQREIPEQQLIIVRSFNPFNMKDGYGISDAVKDDQYSIQQARAYSRKAIRDNVGQRGMLTPTQVMQPEDYENFLKALNKKGQGGKFLATNQPMDYKDMQIDLDKLALATINKVSMETLIAVTGASKTLLGIEESGTTRDTARIQKDLFTENHAIPQLTDILDALNQDYKTNYSEYESNKLEMFVDSPLKVDRETDLKEAQVHKTKAEAAKVLIDTGYEAGSVSDFLELEDLEFEERQPKGLPIPAGELTPKEEEDKEPDEELQQALNQFPSGMEQVVKGYETTLANQVGNIEDQVFATILPKLVDNFAKNALETDKTLTKKEQEQYENDLALALAAFTGGIVALLAGQTTRRRFTEFALPTEFTVTPSVNKTVQAAAKKSAKSHLETFVKASYEEARKAGLEGLAREQIRGRLTSKFPDLKRWQATRIARSESYKAVNLAQFEADKQFIKQNGLEKQAYKKWTVQGKNPCSYCLELAKRPPIPFSTAFLDVGDSIKAEFDQEGGKVTRERVANYESVEAGNLHPNCSCTYELQIR